MQAISVLTQAPGLDCQLSENFAASVTVSEDVKRTVSQEEEEARKLGADEEHEKLKDEEEEEEEDEEFSFFCTNPDGSPISADDVFQDGQIRPVYPIFNRDLLFADDGDSHRREDSSAPSSSSSLRPPLKKLFFEERGDSASESDELDGVAEGTYCEWSKKAKEVSPELRNKSNSTGSSKLWRIRDFVPRSNSDGKDAFVFLNPNLTSKKTETTSSKATAVKSTAVKAPVKEKGLKVKKAETASSAHEKHYVRNRAKKEGDKRRSYLPYRQDLVGFFTNVNGLSRNVHPF